MIMEEISERLVAGFMFTLFALIFGGLLWMIIEKVIPGRTGRQLIGRPAQLVLKLFGESGKLSQMDDFRTVRLDAPEALSVSSQGACEHERVAGVVSCAGNGVTIAEAVYLLRIDGEY